MKNRLFRSGVKVFMMFLVLAILAINIFILFPSPARAIPPKLDWVLWPDASYHCEEASTSHCTPKSALTW